MIGIMTVETQHSAAELAAFREEVRSFFEENLAEDFRRAGERATSVFYDPAISLPWQRILHARGWAAPDWPTEYGGPGWSDEQRYIFAEEYGRARAPSLAAVVSVRLQRPDQFSAACARRGIRPRGEKAAHRQTERR